MAFGLENPSSDVDLAVRFQSGLNSIVQGHNFLTLKMKKEKIVKIPKFDIFHLK